MPKRPGDIPSTGQPPKRNRRGKFRLVSSTHEPPAIHAPSTGNLHISVNRAGEGLDGRWLSTSQLLTVPSEPQELNMNSASPNTTAEPSNVEPTFDESVVGMCTEDSGMHEDDSRVREDDSGTKPKRQRHTTNLDQLTEWLSYRPSFLDEILRHDGLGDFLHLKTCAECGKQDGVIKCKDCAHGGDLKCADCIISLHKNLPLHCIERWNGEFFERDSLQHLGFRYQLGHGGNPCPSPLPGPNGFCVFDISGPCFVTIDYCNCQRNPLPTWTQLLRERWFPATLSRPQTVFTFNSLETFHELTLQAKTNLYDFYHTLMRRFDNAKISKSIDRYSEFHRVFRMWKNLMSLKRAGRAHDPAGIATTSKGGLTVECPACPHPGRNLPDGWEKAGSLLYLYLLYIAVDANFKLKGKERGLKDVDLTPGWGAYVHDKEYKAHISNYVDQIEINTCESEHDAVVRAGTRSSTGYASSGTAVAICSRHCMVRKNGAGDLQKGERYCNMDFIIFAALVGIALPRIIITYDIGCQWSRNVQKRMAKFPPAMQIPASTKLDVAIPGWHINGHGEGCRSNFNLSYMEGAGRTIGEDVETVWAGANLLAPSIREMGPAARRDTLDDHWNGWNFRKIVGFRSLFLKRFRDAFRMKAVQTNTFHQLSATFPAETVSKWEDMVTAWNANPRAPNPYIEPICETTLQDVRLQLTKEEAAQAALGNFSRHHISMSTFLLTGFELEDSQYLLRCESKEAKTKKELADLQEKRNMLLRRIQNWREIQLVYMPQAASLLPKTLSSTSNDSQEITTEFTVSQPHPENLQLYLPSSLPPCIRDLPELRTLCNLERRLREPQASDSLAYIRRQRRVIQGLWQFKRLNVSGTGNKPNTRMISLYKRFEAKTQRAAQQYRVARSSLNALDPDGSWQVYFKELKDKDISGPGRDPNDLSTTNSRYEPSWIWLVPHSNESSNTETVEDEFNDSMRVEWAKARARMMRWKEELEIVQEEMRRVLAYHRWRADWWREQAARREDVDVAVLSGLQGYAYKQAMVCTKMAERCALAWLPRLKENGINPIWESDYIGTDNTPSEDEDDLEYAEEVELD